MTSARTGDTVMAAGALPAWQPAPKTAQTISFGALPNRRLGDSDFRVTATASSGLAVSFSASGRCTISGATVHVTAPGSCTITASQGGDDTYDAAPDVSRTFTVGAPKCTVPKVVGKTLAGAKSELKASHCAAGKVSRSYSKAKKGR